MKPLQQRVSHSAGEVNKRDASGARAGIPYLFITSTTFAPLHLTWSILQFECVTHLLLELTLCIDYLKYGLILFIVQCKFGTLRENFHLYSKIESHHAQIRCLDSFFLPTTQSLAKQVEFFHSISWQRPFGTILDMLSKLRSRAGFQNHTRSL